MAEERYPHLFLSGPTATQDYTSVNKGGSSPRLPDRPSPAEHAAALERKLTEAWSRAAGQQAAAVTTRGGCYIEFRSSPESDLALKSLEHRGNGIRLCRIAKFETTEGTTERALVFIPSGQQNYFLSRFRDYANRVSPKSGNPKNQKMVAPVEDIVAAVLHDFWTDDTGLLPRDEMDWVEVWIAANCDDSVERFRSSLVLVGIEEHPDHPILRFPERSVVLVRASGAQLGALIEASALVCEFRAAREIPTHIMDWANRDQAALCQHLVDRLRISNEADVAVCILDTGVNNGHPLMRPVLSDDDLHALKPQWGTHDSRGHGTLMAGLAAYGDLQAALESNEPVTITHILESSKILPPPPDENPKHLWGHVTSQGASRAEIQDGRRKRIFVLPVTSSDTKTAGHPTSWSAALDDLASGADGSRKRMIVVSAGNVRDGFANYPHENLSNEIHDPAQAWNALTVGAYTRKWRITTSGYEGYRPVASPGQLSPYSTTSFCWDDGLWPIKPEIVLEGGNVAVNPAGDVTDPEDLRLISTCKDFHRSHFWPFEATSAASAQAAWMAAKIQSAYPELWPETVRGLMVHSARWTEEMKQQFFCGDRPKDRWRNLLRVCGYGVPNLRRAVSCVSNSLTLVAEGVLQPFEVRNGRARTKDMSIYELPWPTDELLGLGEERLQMRVTLSYFVESGPGEIGWKDRYRYASHGLRFELNSPGETRDEFVRRINIEARDEENGRPDSRSPSSHWQIGNYRNHGSVHSDIWEGRAADLATSNLVAVRPVIGWWRERPHLGKVSNQTRYALIVSIETPRIESNIYAVVAAKVGIRIPVQIGVSV